MIRNIVFDMGNVLIHWRPELFVDRLGVLEEDRALLLQEVFYDVEWVGLDRGSLPFEDAAAAMCRRLPEHLHRAARALVFDWWKRPLVPVDGMGELIRELKGLGYGIYLLSNAGIDQPQYFDRIPGSECFDGRIISSQFQILKPHPELYQILLRQFSLTAGECFFVDDLPANVEGALRAGMSGHVFRNTVRLRRALQDAGVPVQPPA